MLAELLGGFLYMGAHEVFTRDLGKILKQSWLRYCQDLAMVLILPWYDIIKRAMFPGKFLL